MGVERAAESGPERSGRAVERREELTRGHGKAVGEGERTNAAELRTLRSGERRTEANATGRGRRWRTRIVEVYTRTGERNSRSISETATYSTKVRQTDGGNTIPPMTGGKPPTCAH